MKHLYSRARIAALSLAAATAVMSLSTIAASADDPGVRCAAKVGPGQYEFYLPGERATDVNGVKWVCGPDGNWFRDYSSLVIFYPPTTTVRVSQIAVTSTMFFAP